MKGKGTKHIVYWRTPNGNDGQSLKVNLIIYENDVMQVQHTLCSNQKISSFIEILNSKQCWILPIWKCKRSPEAVFSCGLLRVCRVSPKRFAVLCQREKGKSLIFFFFKCSGGQYNGTGTGRGGLPGNLSQTY